MLVCFELVVKNTLPSISSPLDGTRWLARYLLSNYPLSFSCFTVSLLANSMYVHGLKIASPCLLSPFLSLSLPPSLSLSLSLSLARSCRQRLVRCGFYDSSIRYTWCVMSKMKRRCCPPVDPAKVHGNGQTDHVPRQAGFLGVAKAPAPQSTG